MYCSDRKSQMKKPETTREKWFEERDDLTDSEIVRIILRHFVQVAG